MLGYSFYLKVNKINNTENINKFSNGIISASYSDLHPAPFIKDTVNETIIILGYIIIGDRILSSSDYELMNFDFITKEIKKFNGQFCIYVLDKNNRKFYVVTDRYSSYPVFYFSDGSSLTCSLSYNEIWKNDISIESINQNAFYEFLMLRRLVGEKTYDTNTKYLNSSTILTFELDSGSVFTKTYITLDFQKHQTSFSEQASQLADLISLSIKRRISDNKKYGLLLSGGMDSRVPLAVVKNTFTCFTSCYHKNNEFQTAARVAALDSHPHYFIQRPENFYDQIFLDGIFLCDNMRMFESAGWPFVSQKINEHGIEALFSGFALDYLLGDNYLSRTGAKFLGRFPTMHNCYIEPTGDLASFYLNTISWRYKRSPVEELYSSNNPVEFVHDQIRKEIKNAAELSDDPFDQYLYITVHDLSRHSMFIEPSLIRIFLEERTPGLDNDLFDFSLKIPYSYKSNYKLYRKALTLIDKRYFDIPTANTNYKASSGPAPLFIKYYYNRILQKVGLPHALPPKAVDRAWGNIDEIFTNKNQHICSIMKESRSFILWDLLPQLNRSSIIKRIDDHINNRVHNWHLLNLILTMEIFLESRFAPDLFASRK